MLFLLISLFIKESKAEFIENKHFTMDNISQFIQENLDYPFSVTELAKMVHVHPTWFIRKFKSLTSNTPMKYITLNRMLYARSQLETTTLPIEEIARSVGFSDYAHFSKVFKHYNDYSPQQYRKMFYYRNNPGDSPIYNSFDQLQAVKESLRKKSKSSVKN